MNDVISPIHTNPLPKITTVLYVEDNPMNADLVMRRLRKKDIVTLIAEDGYTGLDYAVRHVPDVILMDFNLPDMDGVEVIKRLRKNQATANIPIVMLTSNTSPQTRRYAYEAGCDGYLTKPVASLELVMMINKLLRLSIPLR